MFNYYNYLRNDVVEYKRHGVASTDEMPQIKIKVITVLLRDIWCLRGYIMAMYLQQTTSWCFSIFFDRFKQIIEIYGLILYCHYLF